MGKAEARESVLGLPPVPLATYPGAFSPAASEQLPIAAHRCLLPVLRARRAGRPLLQHGVRGPEPSPLCGTLAAARPGEARPPSPPGWGSPLPGGDGGLCGTGIFWLNPPLLGSLMQAAPAKPEALVAMAMPER